MIVNRDYRRSLAAKEASKQVRRRTRQRATLVLGMVVLALLAGGAVRLTHWAQQAWQSPPGKAAAVVMEEPRAPAAPVKTPKYQFYEELPRRRVEITEEEIHERPLRLPPGMLEELTGVATEPPASLDAATDLAEGVGQGDAETPRGYLIQAGAFGDPLKADQMRVRIAGLGITARVEPVQVNGNTLSRVRLGPFTNPREVEAMRIRLEGAGIDIDIINRY